MKFLSYPESNTDTVSVDPNPVQENSLQDMSTICADHPSNYCSPHDSPLPDLSDGSGKKDELPSSKQKFGRLVPQLTFRKK